jgi:hypothetical protein
LPWKKKAMANRGRDAVTRLLIIDKVNDFYGHEFIKSGRTIMDWHLKFWKSTQLEFVVQQPDIGGELDESVKSG